jgi:hypothetical protein
MRSRVRDVMPVAAREGVVCCICYGDLEATRSGFTSSTQCERRLAAHRRRVRVGFTVPCSPHSGWVQECIRDRFKRLVHETRTSGISVFGLELHASPTRSLPSPALAPQSPCPTCRAGTAHRLVTPRRCSPSCHAPCARCAPCVRPWLGDGLAVGTPLPFEADPDPENAMGPPAGTFADLFTGERFPPTKPRTRPLSTRGPYLEVTPRRTRRIGPDSRHP